jgi:hypothetical protein
MSNTTNTNFVKFSYFDQRYNKIIDNNIISDVGKSVILYFDQSNIPTTIITQSSSITLTDGINISGVGGNVNISLVGYKFDPPKDDTLHINNIRQFATIYLNGYLTQLLIDPKLTIICYDINKKVVTNTSNNYKLITKVVVLFDKYTISEIESEPILGYSNPIMNMNMNHINFLLSIPLDDIKKTCGLVVDNYKLYDLTNSCYPENTQLLWLPNPDSIVVDYTKPYTIYTLYDANNNVIQNDPKNYPLVKKIAVYMNDTPGPFSSQTPYASIFSLICCVFILIGVIYYFFNTPIPENSKGGLFKLGE